MKIAIIGSGGVGGYFGGKIANAGKDVIFFARGEHLKSLQTNGLKVKSIQGDFSVDKVKATDNIREIGTADLIIVAVKAWQIKELVDEIKEITDQNTIILPLQNGILAIEELQEKISSKNIIGGLCRIQSMIQSPGVINHFGIEPLIIFGESDNSITPRIQELKDFFSTCNIKSRIAHDIHAELWKKFIGICVSGLLAVCKATYGEIRENPETRILMTELLTEIYNLSQKAGINIEHDFLEKSISYIDTFPYNSTSSLTRDIWEGKQSEIEYQNGTVLKLGIKYGVETPVNRFIYYCLLPQERKARNKNSGVAK